ncbi:PspA-associated protein PspAA [Nitrolancea hollandica]|uniref:PspA-associated domain-containing protein n=1 Tax=Nitrolancea hollandica Lb TaxID=1129897 RepID=I4ENJ5_9BACT|nr:hypothetical protein [Nitrolancea hollandica]CCF86258.1 conserved hypothetical protein [Nitrolancea hollandica Lb]
MIVRILTEGQYEIDSDYLDQLNAIDNDVVSAIADGDRERFASLFQDLLSIVRQHGTLVPAEYLHESDVILPPPDTSFEEAAELFVGEGVVPD